ncbi:hypothetical protein ACIQ8D_31020 [Streptomyces sp. NPDC096094]|uniref:hypothetical protein n=1 Tax=Streptomyces sp. NPDC096094 TaxID=3366073 RepID=UPI0037FAD0FB
MSATPRGSTDCARTLALGGPTRKAIKGAGPDALPELLGEGGGVGLAAPTLDQGRPGQGETELVLDGGRQAPVRAG